MADEERVQQDVHRLRELGARAMSAQNFRLGATLTEAALTLAGWLAESMSGAEPVDVPAVLAEGERMLVGDRDLQIELEAPATKAAAGDLTGAIQDLERLVARTRSSGLRFQAREAVAVLSRLAERQQRAQIEAEIRALRAPIQVEPKDLRQIIAARQRAQELLTELSIPFADLRFRIEMADRELEEFRNRLIQATSGMIAGERPETYEQMLNQVQDALAKGYRSARDGITGEYLDLAELQQYSREEYSAFLREHTLVLLKQVDEHLDTGYPEEASKAVDQARNVVSGIETDPADIHLWVAEAQERVQRALAKKSEARRMVEQTRPPIFPLEPTERDWARAWLLLIQVKGIYPAYPGVDEQLAVIAARVPAGFGTILFRELNDGWTALNQAWIEKGEAVRYFALARAHAGIVLDRAPTQYSPDIPGRLREEAIELLAEVDRQERIWQEAVASLDAAYKALGQMNFDTARAATHRVIEASSQAPAAINALTMEAQELETAITTQKRWYGLLAEARHTLAEGQYREACTHVERLLAECRTSRYGTSISWQGDAQEFLEETEQREFREVLLPRGLRQIETALQHNGIITGHDLPELSHTQQVRLFHEYLTEHGDAGLVYLEQDGQPVLRQIQVQPSPPNSPGSPPSPEIPV